MSRVSSHFRILIQLLIKGNISIYICTVASWTLLQKCTSFLVLQKAYGN